MIVLINYASLIYQCISDVGDHLNALQSLRKTNIIHCRTDSTKKLLEPASVNLIPRKIDVLCQRDSSKEQSITFDCQEPRAESISEQCAYSHSSTQTCNLTNPSINRSQSLPVTLNAQLSAGVNKSPETNHTHRQQTALKSGVHNTIIQPRTQTKAVNPNQPSTSQLSSNLGISSHSKVYIKNSVAANSTMQNLSHRKASTSSKYDMQLSAANTRFPSAANEITSDPLEINPEENTSVNDCSLSNSVSSHENMSSAATTSKLFNVHDKNPGLLSKKSTGVKKSDRSTTDVGDTVEDELTNTRPHNRDNVQWIAMPSSSVRQPQRSSLGTTDQEEQTDSPKKSRMATIALTSSEQPGVVYKAVPLRSLLEKGKSYFHTSSC